MDAPGSRGGHAGWRYTEGFVNYLGQFETASGPGGDLEQFCIANYPSRAQ